VCHRPMTWRKKWEKT
ncbi:MAG: DUF2256 domain-containing protein, partial [Candidatus Nanopelagicales bacterium]